MENLTIISARARRQAKSLKALEIDDVCWSPGEHWSDRIALALPLLLSADWRRYE
jgi:hypothetical protein